MALLLASTPLGLSTSLKRERDEEEDEAAALPAEHKKPRTLPFRTAPTSKPPSLFFSQTRRISLPPALTAGNDSDDDSDEDVASPPLGLPLSIRTSMAMNLDDEDDEMQDSTRCISPAWSPKTTTPPRLHTRPTRLRSPSQLSSASSVDNSRIPTPIYSQFGSLSFSPAEGDISSPMQGFSPNKVRARSNALDDEAKHALYLRRRRLPSPISEIDMDSPISSRTTPTLGSFSQPKMMDHDSTGACTPPTPVSGEFAKGLSWERGRKRSDAVSDGVGCGQGSGKVVFSMGFRMGCERCRERVPGHYNHVLRGC